MDDNRAGREESEEMEMMSEEDLRKVYHKLFEMRPMMSMDFLIEMLTCNEWDEKKCMTELYRLREGMDVDADAQPKNKPINPATESPARPDKMRSNKLKGQQPSRQSSRRKLMSRAALSETGRSRPRIDSSSPELLDDDMPGPVEDDERRARKRQKLSSSRTSLSRDQSNEDSVDYEAKFVVIDDREVRRVLQKEEVEESGAEEKEERRVAMIAQDTKKADHTTVTPWIGRLAGGLYVKTLLVTEEFDDALKDKEGVVAEMKKKGELKSIIDMTVNREKLWKEGWNGKHVTDSIKFLGKSTWENETKTGYGTVHIDGQIVKIGDCVVIRPGEDEGAKNLKKKKYEGEAAAQIWFGKVMSMFHDSSVRDLDDQEQVHVRWFNHGGDSFLSETAGPRELFLLSRCDNIPLTTVAGKVQIDKITTVGPVETNKNFHEVNHYFYRFHDDETENFPHCWEDASFHEDDPNATFKFEGEQEPCYSCNKKAQVVAESLARTAKDSETNEINRLWWQGKQFHLGDFVYIQPNDLMQPYVIGRLKKIIYVPARSKVRRVDDEMVMDDAYDIEILSFRRHKEFCGDYFKDAMEYKEHKVRDERRLYQTPRIRKYDVERLIGKCNVVHGERVEDLETYKMLSDTFYVLDHIPEEDGEGTNKGKHKEEMLQPLKESDFEDSCDANKMVNEDKARREEFAKAGRKLLAMDVFAGCGGLTHGLDAGGAVETRWAVEWDVEAASTFKKNFPHAIMYNEDVNKLLHQARKEELGLKTRPLRDRSGKIMPRMPKRGQVDFLYGGPPCQDFSGANRFKKANSIKNSLLTVYLSLLDHYQPAHFMLENVKDLLYHRLGSSQASKHKVAGGIEQGSVKFILRALMSLGYSAQYNVLQAAEHGSPQSRRRVFFMGTKLGIRLPLYPQPTHTCLTVATHTRNKAFSAPHGPVSIGDAISDLPQFDWGCVIPEDDQEWLRERAKHVKQVKFPLDRGLFVGRQIQPYGQPPSSNYQSWLRSGEPANAQVRNHYTAHFQEANLLRVLGVPMVPLANWKDAPQHYIAEGLKRSGDYTRYNNRYQRLDASSAFQTCMTSMDPSSMAVIHPYNRRTLSVRELARAQGFPDWFVWEDGLDDQGRKRGGARGRPMRPKACIKQIGNAVSGCHGLPLGKAIFDVEYERWVKEGKPQMEPRRLSIQLTVGQGLYITDSDPDEISESEDSFTDEDVFEAKDDSNSDDEMKALFAPKTGKPNTKPVIRLNSVGGNEVIVITDDSDAPPRRPQGTFVQGHRRPGIGKRAAATKKRVNKTYREKVIITSDEFSDDEGAVDTESEGLFVEQGIGAPPRDEMDDEEFARWLAFDGGKFEDEEALTQPERVAEIARLECGAGTPLAGTGAKPQTNGGSRRGSGQSGKKAALVPVKRAETHRGAFVESDSEDEVLVVEDESPRKPFSSIRKISSSQRSSTSSTSAKNRPAVRFSYRVEVQNSDADADADAEDEEEEDILVVKEEIGFGTRSLSGTKNSSKATSVEKAPPVEEVAKKVPVVRIMSHVSSSPAAYQSASANPDNDKDHVGEDAAVEGDKDKLDEEAEIEAEMEADKYVLMTDDEPVPMETQFSDAIQGIESNDAAEEIDEEMDENLKFKLASWAEARA